MPKSNQTTCFSSIFCADMVHSDGTGSRWSRRVTPVGKASSVVPNCCGVYHLHTTANSEPYFVRDDAAFVLFYTGEKWTIAPTVGDHHLWPGDSPVNCWESDAMDGCQYTPAGTCAGMISVNGKGTT